MITTNWTDILDNLVCEAITAGRVTGKLSGAPDDTFESGLAHIFFYGDTVYKLYKTHADKNHFIKGVLAPTRRRMDFLQHDFALNQHFSSDVYRQIHSVWYDDGVVRVTAFDPKAIYTLVEMARLDFTQNLHERLLRGDITETELEELGYETARAIDTCPITVPEEVNWYALACGRVELLKQFVDWLPEDVGNQMKEAQVIEALETHLATHQAEYRLLSGAHLTVNVDNHDENVFFVNGKPQFIDLLPPMETWWYGLPCANVSNVMANVEALHSTEAAEVVQQGYIKYYGGEALPERELGFTHAFAYLISIAHFGSIPEKRPVVEKYVARISEIPSWL